jgi:2-dehydro-3-deoxygluconokinase
MKVVTFGEIMLRLSPPGFSRIVQAKSLEVNYGGGEANVAVALAHFGLDAHFVSKLPTHEVGQAAINSLRGYGVNTKFVARGGDRVGIYFLETGASQRGSKVIYDRAQSAVTTLRPEELDWDEVFDGARWFHWTGITPALGSQANKTLTAACVAAREAGATISCDLNFRKKLWTEEEAQATMRPLMEYVDVCIANEEDAEKCLGVAALGSDVQAGHLEEAGYARVAQILKETFNFSAVAITLRESFSASLNGWSAILLDDADCTKPVRSTRYEIQLVDRVGGGDAFASGLIAGLLRKGSTRDALEFAVAASCLKQTIPGDVNLVSVEEVNNLIAGGGSGRVDR